MKKILVTGGAGFIGSNLVDHLCGVGYEVLVIDNFLTGKRENLASALRSFSSIELLDFCITSVDARNAIENFQPECILHLAAQYSVSVSMKDPRLDAKVNIVGLVNVLEAARSSGCKKIVFASSGGTIYGDKVEALDRVDELANRDPSSFYGLTKSVGLDYLNLYSRHFGLDFVALALANVFGPRQDPGGEAGVVAIFAKKILEGQVCTINGDGKTTRDYVYVDDVVDAFERSINRGNGLINIGTGIEKNVLQIRDALADVVGNSSKSAHGPALKGEVRRVCLNTTRAKTQLDWTPKVDFESGLRSVVDWIRKENM